MLINNSIIDCYLNAMCYINLQSGTTKEVQRQETIEQQHI